MRLVDFGFLLFKQVVYAWLIYELHRGYSRMDQNQEWIGKDSRDCPLWFFWVGRDRVNGGM